MNRRGFLGVLGAVLGLRLTPDTPTMGLDLATGPDYTVITGNFPGGPVDQAPEAFFRHAVRPWLTVNECWCPTPVRLRVASDDSTRRRGQSAAGVA